MLESKQQTMMDTLVEPVLVSVREEERLLQFFSHNLPLWEETLKKKKAWCVLNKNMLVHSSELTHYQKLMLLLETSYHLFVWFYTISVGPSLHLNHVVDSKQYSNHYQEHITVCSHMQKMIFLKLYWLKTYFPGTRRASSEWLLSHFDLIVVTDISRRFF